MNELEERSRHYRVRSLRVAVTEAPGPQVFWQRDWDRSYPLWVQVLLVQGHGVTALVNAGPRQPAGSTEEGSIGAAAGEHVLDHLDRLGISPADVTHVLVTPLQYYTTGNLLTFPNAQICLSQRGWRHLHETHGHPHDQRYGCIPKDVLVGLVTDAWDRVRLLADEETVVPGIRSWWCGGHHRASQVFEIDTGVGVVAATDAAFLLANVEDDLPLGISENIYETLDTYERLRADADIIVPLYDPAVFDRFPDGVISD